MSTFAIIHGAGDSGRNWRLVAGELARMGHQAVAPDLPCEDDAAGLPEYADTVVDAIGDRDDVVVVAHSLGGFTAPLVCERVSARLLVLVTAMVPAPGERAAEWWANTGYGGFVAEHPQPKGEIELFMHDVPEDLAAEALAAGRDQSGTPMNEPWPLAQWPDVPTRYLVCRDDRCHPADWARGMVRERLGMEADEIDGSHCVYLSHPLELAERLDGYVAARASAA